MSRANGGEVPLRRSPPFHPCIHVPTPPQSSDGSEGNAGRFSLRPFPPLPFPSLPCGVFRPLGRASGSPSEENSSPFSVWKPVAAEVGPQRRCHKSSEGPLTSPLPRSIFNKHTLSCRSSSRMFPSLHLLFGLFLSAVLSKTASLALRGKTH